MIYKTKSPKETEKIAGLIVKKILKTQSIRSARACLVVALEGELGAGKTVFSQGFARAFKIKTKLKSPTFVLMKKYSIGGSGFAFRSLYHLDCYRLTDYKDLLPLNIKELLKDPQNIFLIEWADRVAPILPKNCVKIHIDHIGSKERNIKIVF